MPYRLKISRRVQRDIDRLPGNIRQRVKQTVAALAFNPRPTYASELHSDLVGFMRIRLDDYRIIYTIDDDIVVVEIVRVARRSPDTYVGLS